MSEKFVKNPNYAATLRPSPGPARYKLPTLIGCNGHDPRKVRMPCYTMAKKVRPPAADALPGPADYQVANLNRFGRVHVPAYIGRLTKGIAADATPGPNVYKLPVLMGKQRATNYMHRAPDYTFGQRLDLNTNDRIPGPAEYRLKNGVSAIRPKAPAYTMVGRTKDRRNDPNPGPGKYFPIQSTCGRIWPSLRSRNEPSFKSESPAPNEYNTSYYKPGRRAPAYTMGSRDPDWLLPPITKADMI